MNPPLFFVIFQETSFYAYFDICQSNADGPHIPGAQKVLFSIASTKGLQYIMRKTDRQDPKKAILKCRSRRACRNLV